MRSSAAAFDEFDASPVRRAPRKGSSKAGKRTKKGRGQKLNVIAKYAALGAGVAIAGGIMANALMFQKGRHPAPLFGNSNGGHHFSSMTAQPAIRRAEPEKAAAVDPPAPPKTAAASREIAPVTQPAALPITGDPIGQLLRRSAGAGNAGGSRVHGAQEALIKLGYPLKATGSLNGPTRKALAAFAKLHHLPVKGELDQRTLKALSAASHLHLT